jgi:hypothetical protein
MIMETELLSSLSVFMNRKDGITTATGGNIHFERIHTATTPERIYLHIQKRKPTTERSTAGSLMCPKPGKQQKICSSFLPGEKEKNL